MIASSNRGVFICASAWVSPCPRIGAESFAVKTAPARFAQAGSPEGKPRQAVFVGADLSASRGGKASRSKPLPQGSRKPAVRKISRARPFLWERTCPRIGAGKLRGQDRSHRARASRQSGRQAAPGLFVGADLSASWGGKASRSRPLPQGSRKPVVRKASRARPFLGERTCPRVGAGELRGQDRSHKVCASR